MDVAEAYDDSFGIEVILPEGGKTAPCCPHGPTLLFEKVSKGGEEGRRFYACSACRDRKDCSFFQWEDDKVSEARLLAREAENRSKRPPFSQQEYCTRFRKFASLPVDEKKFCQDCQLLLLPREQNPHKYVCVFFFLFICSYLKHWILSEVPVNANINQNS
uniref:GRF-type domain-containing protein n=1 Tax=Lates calcarifer TaxID=8187 RepID=A0A4W6DGF4_LATCA